VVGFSRFREKIASNLYKVRGIAKMFDKTGQSFTTSFLDGHPGAIIAVEQSSFAWA
jgi:hypothetical protein